jgi:hypothetical protein
MLSFKRPGSGLEPRFIDKVTGMTAKRNISRNTILQWEDLALPLSSDPVSENLHMGNGTAGERTRSLKEKHA